MYAAASPTMRAGLLDPLGRASMMGTITMRPFPMASGPQPRRGGSHCCPAFGTPTVGSEGSGVNATSQYAKPRLSSMPSVFSYANRELSASRVAWPRFPGCVSM